MGDPDAAQWGVGPGTRADSQGWLRRTIEARVLALLFRLCRTETWRFVYGIITLNTYRVDGDVARLTIGTNVQLANTLFNTGSGTIDVQDDVFFGHGVTVIAGKHDWHVTGPKRQTTVPRTGDDIVIETGAWVSSNVTLIGPCRIGRYAVVAAGAVVTHDVPSRAIVAGIPAQVIGHVGEGPARW